MCDLISEHQWLEFVDGTADPVVAGRIRRHTEVCRECARTLDELRRWHIAIGLEATRLSRSVELTGGMLDRMLAESLGRIQELEPAALAHDGGWTPDQAVVLLRSLMEPICGLGAARAAMNVAISRATAGGANEVTASNWPVLVANLSEALASICGVAAGRLVDRAGYCVSVLEG